MDFGNFSEPHLQPKRASQKRATPGKRIIETLFYEAFI